jgi:AMP-binding enzyme
VILGDPNGRPSASGIGGRSTLDDLFRRAAADRPDVLALIDPPNREAFTDFPARALTYAQADRVISAIAGRLRRIGLRSDAIIGLQLANTIESVLTFLAVLRAGMIAMPMPLLWRRADLAAALGRAGASALIVNGRVGQHNQFDDALQTAAETFQIRFVCGFGSNPPEGFVALNEMFTAESLDPLPAPDERPYPPGPAAHLAIITWEVGSDGPVPVARSHAELAAGGLSVLLEGRLKQHATILTTLALSSFGGFATSVLPWLLIGGTLALHHPFDLETFTNQQRALPVDTIVLPGTMVTPLVDAGTLTLGGDLRSIIAIWPSPERLSRSQSWREASTDLIDVQVFGETGLVAARRAPGGRPGPVPFGPITAPRGTKGGVIVGEIRATASGTVALRGPMVPRAPFPPGVERTPLPQMKIAAGGFVDTSFACWSDQGNTPLVVTAPPPGMISVGGYRFLMRELQDTIAEIDPGATLAALPDPLTGQKLAGSATNASGVQQALVGRGVNPLLVSAFRARHANGGNGHA